MADTPGGQVARLNGAERLARRERIWELKLRGVPERDIAEEFGISRATVRKDFRWILDRQELPNADEYRRQSIGRLTMASRALLSEIDRCDRQGKSVSRAVEVLSKVEERVAKMLGADAPEQLSVDHTVTVQSPDVVAAIDAARERVAERERTMVISDRLDRTVPDDGTDNRRSQHDMDSDVDTDEASSPTPDSKHADIVPFVRPTDQYGHLE